MTDEPGARVQGTDAIAIAVAGDVFASEGRGTLKRVRNALIAAVVLAVLVLSLVVSYSEAFGHPRIDGMSVAVTGNSSVITRLEQQKGLDLTVVDSRSAARSQVTDRKVDAAFIIPASSKGTLVTIVATGPSRTLALTAEQVGAKIADQLHAKTSVIDVAAPTSNNPNGTVEFYLVVFLTVGAAIGATVFGRVLGTMRSAADFLERTAVLAIYSALISASSAFYTAQILQAITPGHGWPVFGALFLYALAVSGVVTGIGTVGGTLASAACSIYFVVFGNGSSGGPFSTHLQAPFFQVVHWIVPQSYGLELVHCVEYFDGNGSTWPIVALALVGGIGLAVSFGGMLVHAAQRRPAGRPSVPAPAPVPSAAPDQPPTMPLPTS
jgi:hypothetical protein